MMKRRFEFLFFAGMVLAAGSSMAQIKDKPLKIAPPPATSNTVAKTFGIRTGMDFAWSEDNFAFYFTTGTAWGQK